MLPKHFTTFELFCQLLKNCTVIFIDNFRIIVYNMLNNIFEVGSVVEISMTKALICIAVSLVLGFIISLIYIATDRKRRFSTNFAITLVMLPALVSIVIMLVGSDVA